MYFFEGANILLSLRPGQMVEITAVVIDYNHNKNNDNDNNDLKPNKFSTKH